MYLCTRLTKATPKAPVAQLVEHLTLNQGVQGSTPCRRTKREKTTHTGCLLIILYRQCILQCTGFSQFNFNA